MRENSRTGRTPQQVIDDAMWGVFQEGWNKPWGADADHIKNAQDIKKCVEAGYTFYTIDPGDYVDNDVYSDEINVLKEKFNLLPWSKLEATSTDFYSLYLDKTFSINNVTIHFDKKALLRASCKYSRAIVHIKEMYRYLLAHK